MGLTPSVSVGRSYALLVLAAAMWVFIMSGTWSQTPFWPDADGYTSHVAEGRWVAHPPGYMIFVLVGHGFHALGLPAYGSVQFASLFFAVAALPVLFCLFRRVCEAREALLLTVIFAFSWNVLILSRTGTSHAGDFFTVSALLLLATSPSFRASHFGTCLLYGAAIVVCAGTRLTTAIMLVPFFALVLFRNRQNANLWIAYTLAGLAVIALQTSVIMLSGGWIPYSEYSQSMHLGNKPSSLVLSGINSVSLLNLFRTLGWWSMSVSLLLLIPLAAICRARGWWLKKTAVPHVLSANQMELLFYGGASAGGCLGMAGLYLCTHPGYLSAALPGTFACVAATLPLVPKTTSNAVFALSMAASVGFFMLAKPISDPKTPFQAAANGLLLQYTGTAIKNSLFKTTSHWLRDTGNENLVPEHHKMSTERAKEGKL